jgi:hypothetical protein
MKTKNLESGLESRITSITDVLPGSTVGEEFCFRKRKDAEQFIKQGLTPSLHFWKLFNLVNNVPWIPHDGWPFIR